ncbi:MAG: glycosyltransferase family 9 protein, partial [Candidatus Gastranaerophilales bacterium]|nr:glycosyltransferase family 9 protein [Candidatus Gastranaerophilales bacterium]
SLFCPLLDLPNTQFYSLQVGFGSEQLENLPDKSKIINLALSISDFSDTAAAIENLDLLITIDSSVAHLAGALGKKTWIILPTNLEWRWFLDEDKTVWYESARLFRPKLGQDKSEVISRIYRNLTEIL